MVNISTVIITNNSADIIEKTVKGVQWCDEIIIVDSGSTDDTVGICAKLGCKTYSRDFTGYGEQKNHAASLAKNDWILSIDADEVVSEELKNEIQAIFKTGEIGYAGFSLPITLVFCGRVFKHCENSKPHLRLYNKNFASFNLSKVHEKVVIEGKTRVLKNEILHYSFRNISNYIQKMDIYTSKGADDLFENKKKFSYFFLFIRFPFDFFKFYFIRGCIFEGFPGFIWAMLSSFYPMVKYFKLYEIRRLEEK
jgi:glycosyltransferase involved in cell wall biosynthesis